MWKQLAEQASDSFVLDIEKKKAVIRHLESLDILLRVRELYEGDVDQALKLVKSVTVLFCDLFDVPRSDMIATLAQHPMFELEGGVDLCNLDEFRMYVQEQRAKHGGS